LSGGDGREGEGMGGEGRGGEKRKGRGGERAMGGSIWRKFTPMTG